MDTAVSVETISLRQAVFVFLQVAKNKKSTVVVLITLN